MTRRAGKLDLAIAAGPSALAASVYVLDVPKPSERPKANGAATI